MQKITTLLKNLGPGLLFASMAIGTSHLVLSTKAGAQYGWIMLIPIVLANILKYPFFEFGIRYTNATNKTLIEGYLNRGKGYLWFYALITLVSTFTILAALYLVTSGLLINLFKLTNVSINLVAFVLFGFISALLIIGKYVFLEKSLKIIVSILGIALLVTTVIVVFKGKVDEVANFKPPTLFSNTSILFIIGLVGWMPTAVETSSWLSMWTIEKQKLTSKKLNLKEALSEFNFGYIITAILAIFFMTIGCLSLYGTNTEMSSSAVGFADQLINLFTVHIGEWTTIFVATAAFATMFSSCMTAHDAIARVSIDVLQKLKNKTNNNTIGTNKRSKSYFTLAVLVLAVINLGVIVFFNSNMGKVVALATFVSFIVAPIVGYMNLKNVMSDDVASEDKPKKWLKLLTYAGILFLSLFAVYYCYIEIIV
ncbi:NRAMP family divalent metal transporter [Cellulophaga omnivescoria]|uniref:NRAMP family divalent metal transporter n=1 Tax=Cellulophaga omnivescoria TaxID=1888890 RepID=UPI0022F0168D|nr:divalent metal cation transporter [Cellulophaga omnivescoria]WBU88100.1 divalent metal cation transporter [Cellulophaga omnivescoria]